MAGKFVPGGPETAGHRGWSSPSPCWEPSPPLYSVQNRLRGRPDVLPEASLSIWNSQAESGEVFSFWVLLNNPLQISIPQGSVFRGAELRFPACGTTQRPHSRVSTMWVGIVCSHQRLSIHVCGLGIYNVPQFETTHVGLSRKINCRASKWLSTTR